MYQNTNNEIYIWIQIVVIYIQNINFLQRDILDIEVFKHFALVAFNGLLNLFRATGSHETFHSRPI